MVAPRTVKWAVGIGIVVLLALIPTTCIDWRTDKRAVEAAERLAAVQFTADSLLVERDRAQALADSARDSADALRRQLRRAQQRIPAPPPPVVGCEACQERAALLEAALDTAGMAIVGLEGEVAAVRRVNTVLVTENTSLRNGLDLARRDLEDLARPRPVLKMPFLRRLLPTLQVGYGVVGGLNEGAVQIHHGPGVHLGWRVSF